MLRITHAPGYEPERGYVLRVIFEEFLGLKPVAIDTVPSFEGVRIALEGDPLQARIELDDVLFKTLPADWLSARSMPRLPLCLWEPRELCSDWHGEPIPILYSRLPRGPRIQVTDSTLQLGIDILGSIFFMLTRYEELVNPARDRHDRFPATASLAYHAGCLHRPLADEYVEILWLAMKRLWPGLRRRKAHTYQVGVSHDVDWPFEAYGRPWPAVMRSVAGDVIKRRQLDLAWRRFLCRLRQDALRDPANTFDFIMNQSERLGLVSEFYFIADHTAGDLDGTYSLADPEIQALISRIYQRGHRLGLHPSYNSYRDGAQIRLEFERLGGVVTSLGIHQELWGGRQHYLRWENPVTWQHWEDAGLHYDSTLGFADHVGYRCGTCREFPVFNLLTRQPLRLKERPLVVMEGTLLGREYMDCAPANAMEWMLRLATTCRRYGGRFTLLWHNSSLTQEWQRALYREVLEAITR